MNPTSITKGKKKSKKAFDYLQYRVEIKDNKNQSKKIINMNDTTRTIKETIATKQLRQGKNGKDYLLLKLDNNETIFVFPNQDTPADRWSELTEGERYTFTVKEGLNASNVLVAFELDLFN